MSNSARRRKAKKIRTKLCVPSPHGAAPSVNDDREPYVDPIAAALTATPEPTDVRTLPAVEPVAAVEPNAAAKPVAAAKHVAVARSVAAAPVVAAAPSAPTFESLDDTSVPPIGDLDVRDLDSHFFDGPFFAATRIPDNGWRLDPELNFEHEFPDPHRRKWTASAARRRAELAKYVVGVVSVASALCLAALIRGAVPRSDDDLAAPVAAHRPSVVEIDTGLPAAMPTAPSTPTDPSPPTVAPASSSEPASTATGAAAPAASESAGRASAVSPPSTAR